MNRITFAASVLTTLAYNVYSQDFPLAGTEYYHYSPVDFEDSPANTELSFEEFAFYINLPKMLKEDTSAIMVNGLVYAQVQAKSFDGLSQEYNVKDYHKITYRFTYIWKLENDWSAVFSISPTLASDLEQELSSDDFFIQASTTLTKEVSKDFSVGFGIAYTSTLGVPLPLPVSIVRYKDHRHHFQSLLPQMVGYHYDLKPDESLKIGFKGELNGALFNTNFSNPAFDFTVDNVNYSRANVGATISYRFLKFIKVEAFGGFSTFRRYRFNDEGGNDYEFNSKSNAFFNIGIALVPPTPKKK